MDSYCSFHTLHKVLDEYLLQHRSLTTKKLITARSYQLEGFSVVHSCKDYDISPTPLNAYRNLLYKQPSYLRVLDFSEKVVFEMLSICTLSCSLNTWNDFHIFLFFIYRHIFTLRQVILLIFWRNYKIHMLVASIKFKF